MEYIPVTAVWEITMGCNLRCKHCGSSCEDQLAGELTTEEAVNLAKELGEMGFQWITISGGEPTTRKDWDVIAKALYDNGIIPNMITNGWLFDEALYQKAVAANISTLAFSIDGLKETHDSIRREGSFERIMSALDILKGKKELNPAVITTINNQNLSELPKMKEIFEEKNIRIWQLQIGLPMGNMAQNKDLVIKPYQIDEIIDFAYNAIDNTTIDIQLADCLGYYNLKEVKVRQKDMEVEEYGWQGCNAGKYGLGILHNGDVIGCTSIRDKDQIEGNIKITPIKQIWESEDSFKWNRSLTKDQLKGFCAKCRYGSNCLGGCANTRVAMDKDLFGENKYCSYNYAVSRARDQLNEIDDIDILNNKAKKFMDNNNFQLAEICLAKIIEILGPKWEEKLTDQNIKVDRAKVMKIFQEYGYVCFMLENYQASKEVNERILLIEPNDIYANKGVGVVLSKLGFIEKGIEHLKKSIDLAQKIDYTDPYHDLAVVYYENKMFDEAKKTLESGFRKSPEFKKNSQWFYEKIVEDEANF